MTKYCAHATAKGITNKATPEEIQDANTPHPKKAAEKTSDH